MEREEKVLVPGISFSLLLSASYDSLLKSWNSRRSEGRRENHISHFIVLCKVVFAVNCPTKTPPANLHASYLKHLIFLLLPLSCVCFVCFFLLSISLSSPCLPICPLTLLSVYFYKRKTMLLRQRSS